MKNTQQTKAQLLAQTEVLSQQLRFGWLSILHSCKPPATPFQLCATALAPSARSGWAERRQAKTVFDLRLSSFNVASQSDYAAAVVAGTVSSVVRGLSSTLRWMSQAIQSPNSARNIWLHHN